MGLHFSRIWERMFGKKEMRILMVGLDAAGKVQPSLLATLALLEPKIPILLRYLTSSYNDSFISPDYYSVQA